MKFGKSLMLILVLALTGFAYTSVIRVEDDVRKALEAVYAKIDTATEEKDMKTLESLLGADYEKQSGGKTLKRAEVVAQMKKSFDSVKEIVSSKTTIDKIKQVEGNQIVDYTQTSKVVVAGEDGKDQTVEFTSKGRDWWVEDEDGDWICVSSERL
jgi:hypothetical protein